MENRSDYEKRLGEKLEAAYMLEDIEPGMSREEFHRLILAAEKRKKRRRSLLGLAAACVALCLVCGGFMAGMTMRESASAGKDDETKTVQQGDSVVIGSGINEKNQNVGVSIKTYTDIEDIPEDVRKEIHFLDSDEFELEKVKMIKSRNAVDIFLYYTEGIEDIIIKETGLLSETQKQVILKNSDNLWKLGDLEIFAGENDQGMVYFFIKDEIVYSVLSNKSISKEKIEAIVVGLNKS